MNYSKILNKIYSSAILGILLTMSAPCSASVPHSVDKYNFHIDLPDGFTKLVIEEVDYQRVYDSYHGNHDDKSFVHIRIQKQDSIEDWKGAKLQQQLNRTLNIYKSNGAKIIKADVIHLEHNDGLLIQSRHDGKEHLTLQMYVHGTMYIVTSTFDADSKYGIKDFMAMMYSVQCLK